MNKLYTGSFAGTDVHFEFRYKETVKYFEGWLTEEFSKILPLVQVTEQDYIDQKRRWNIPDGPYTEYSLSVYRACDELLKQNRCIFHGAAILWNNKAFIFTGPSGTGKSTQIFNWCTLYEDEILIMNGDKPIINFDHAKKIMVYPSPWKGKERIGDDSIVAPLGGIIILKQGNVNLLKRLNPDHSVPQLIKRILFTVENRELVLAASKAIEAIVSSVPVWEVINKGDMESSKMTHDAIQKELRL